MILDSIPVAFRAKESVDIVVDIDIPLAGHVELVDEIGIMKRVPQYPIDAICEKNDSDESDNDDRAIDD